MTKDVDCQVFEDQLDALVREELPEEGRRHLLLHAETCRECSMQLRVQEQLVGPPLKALEEQVPEEMLEDMWSRVEGSLPFHDAKKAPIGQPSGLPRRRPSFGWALPALAAATLALLFSSGFLLWETRRLSDESALLAQQVLEQRRWMSEMEAGAVSDPVVRTAALAGRNPFARALSRQDEISVGGLQNLLERIPGDRIILDGARLDGLLLSRGAISQPLLRDLLDTFDGREGVQARDLIRALESMDVSPTLTVPTSDLMEILS